MTNKILLVGVDMEEVLFYTEVIMKLFSALWARAFRLEMARTMPDHITFAVKSFWTEITVPDNFIRLRIYSPKSNKSELIH